MGWKDWSYAKKGWVIGLIISIILSFISTLDFSLHATSKTISVIARPASMFAILLMIIGIAIPPLFNLFFSNGNTGLGLPNGITILGFIIIFLVLAYIGALIGKFIGWIVGKIKSKKESNIKS